MVYGNRDYSELEKVLGYTFKNKSFLDTAFTHRSFANEYHITKVASYERLEFLGDAILEFISSRTLYERYPEKTEGELTQLRASLVCEYTLSQITDQLDFGTYLYLSRGEEMTGGRKRKSILCDLFESVLGAIYLDGGIEEAFKYVEKFLLTDIEKKTLFYDAKSILQEYAQKHGATLDYEIVKESGPDHNKTYTVVARLDGVVQQYGTDHKLKEAEREAAHKTIMALGLA